VNGKLLLVLPSGFVTITFQLPVARVFRLNAQDNRLEEMKNTEVPGISGSPARVSRTVAPFMNPEPARLVIMTVVPLVPEPGVIPVITGDPPGGGITVGTWVGIPDGDPPVPKFVDASITPEVLVPL
jgi:hypothetical protein